MAKETSFNLPADNGADDLIQTIAHNIWVDEGCPEGKTEELWARASLIVAAFNSIVEEEELSHDKSKRRVNPTDPDWLVRTAQSAPMARAVPRPWASRTRRSVA